MKNRIHAPIPSLKSPSDPDKLCAPIGNSCAPVSQTKLMFRNNNDTAWKRQGLSSFRSLDKNFGRTMNDKPKRGMTNAARIRIQQLRKESIDRKNHYLAKAKEYQTK